MIIVFQLIKCYLKCNRKRKKQHLVTTYYTYCADCKPNTFTFSDPAEAAWIPLYSIKLGLCGYLRWAYNSWGEDPLRDSRFRQWPAGDTYLVYPGFVLLLDLRK